MASVFEKRSANIDGRPTPGESPFQQRSKQKEASEPLWKTLSRYAGAAATGLASATVPGITANVMQLLGTGAALDPEEIEQIRRISEEQGIPFDEEAYLESVQKAAEMFPTPSNIARMAEEETGLPLTAKTKGQKLVELGASAGKFATGTPIQRGAAAVVAPSVSAVSQKLGVPEPLADILGLGVSVPVAAKAELSFAKKKPSGLAERGFESLEKPREVSVKKLEKINAAVEKDFKEISDKIIKESPVGETFENLRNDPTFKQESRELLNQAQVIADKMPSHVKVSPQALQKEMADIGAQQIKGFTASEYDKSFAKFLKEGIQDMPKGDIRPGQLVEQYRKNNAALGEYFEPGSSKAYNRAKRDALLNSNRAIANVMEKSFPESELAPVFKEGNARWTKVMDAETIDEFVSDLFEGKVNFKKGERFFEDRNYERIFKRSLGDEYPKFEQLMKDMLVSEAPYKMLKVAKEKGFSDLFNHAKYYVLHPYAGMAKTGTAMVKEGYKTLINSMLDKPKLTIQWSKAVNDLKKGDFKAAEQGFKALDAEILPAKKEAAKSSVIEPETIEAKVERVQEPSRALEHKPPKSQEEPTVRETKEAFKKYKARVENPKKEIDLIPEAKESSKPKGMSEEEAIRIVREKYKKTYNPETKLWESTPSNPSKITSEKPKKMSSKLPKPTKGDLVYEFGKETIIEPSDIFDGLFSITKRDGEWAVSHVPSGARLTGFKHKKSAINLMKDIFEGDLIDRRYVNAKTVYTAGKMFKNGRPDFEKYKIKP